MPGAGVLSVWYLIMSQGPARAGFLGPGRTTLGAYYGRVDKDPQSARGSLLNTTPKVSFLSSSHAKTSKFKIATLKDALPQPLDCESKHLTAMPR